MRSLRFLIVEGGKIADFLSIIETSVKMSNIYIYILARLQYGLPRIRISEKLHLKVSEIACSVFL